MMSTALVLGWGVASVSTFITQGENPADAWPRYLIRCASQIVPPPVEPRTAGSTMWNGVRVAPGKGKCGRQPYINRKLVCSEPEASVYNR